MFASKSRHWFVWLMVLMLAKRLSDEQIRDAFRAANYSAEEVEVLTKAFKTRVNALEKLG